MGRGKSGTRERNYLTVKETAVVNKGTDGQNNHTAAYLGITGSIGVIVMLLLVVVVVVVVYYYVVAHGPALALAARWCLV